MAGVLRIKREGYDDAVDRRWKGALFKEYKGKCF